MNVQTQLALLSNPLTELKGERRRYRLRHKIPVALLRLCVCMSVRNKSTSHPFPQETLETGSLAPTTESPTLLPALGPHHSTRGSPKSCICNTSDPCLATFQGGNVGG